ncbi:FAD-dependent monooxygenase [Kitasatospora sp. NPDC050543]|uniref:FAD-dependent monooxygenase n=1 Tax=Kitasatospora sp. NPDC050543 TaxID=3364054 RepID=UPI00378D97EF
MTEVLIVGGGTVGLSAAVFLAHHGVQVHLVERQDGPQVHPRATGVGMRTVELLREVGLADAVNEVAIDMTAGNLGKISAETLAAADLPARPKGPAHPNGRGRTRTSARSGADTPYTPAALRGTCPQNRLDAVLLAAARERGAVVEYGAALVSFEQRGAVEQRGGFEQDGADGVTAVLSDGRTLGADYLVAADGARSQVRTALGIGTSGPGNLGEPLTNTLFRADLDALTGGHSFVGCDLTHPDAPGMLITVDGSKEWVLHTARDRMPTPDYIRTALGAPELDVEIISTLPWRVRGQVADRFADGGRVFLIGDAAHAVPPLGAFGMNTGIADAHNLAWKLALVLRGEAGAALLDSYQAERRPVALLTLDQAVRRLADPRLHWGSGPGAAKARAAAGVVNAPVVHLGYRYDSTAVIDARPELPSTEQVTLDGAPGSLLPHAWLGDGVSTLDLVNSRFTLFTRRPDAAGPHRPDAWRSAAERLGLPVHEVDLPEIPVGGALLVRPDGFIAWRTEAIAPPSPDATPRTAPAEALDEALTEVLKAALGRVLSRPLGQLPDPCTGS